MPPSKKEIQADEKVLDDFLACLQRAEKPHTTRCQRYDKCYDVYNGILAPKDDTWESRLHPPYVLQVVELIESNMIDDKPRVKVSPTRPEDEAAAAAMERLLEKQRGRDNFAEKQPEFVKQALITGLSVAKVPWLYETRNVTRRKWEPRISQTGQVEVVEVDPVTKFEVTKNQPGFVPWDVRHFLWDPAARSLDDAVYIFFRSYVTMAHLKAMEKAGVYKNVDEVTAADAPREAPGSDDRDLRGRIELLEKWTRDEVTVVANRNVVLRHEPTPLIPGELPAVAATTLPQPFMLGGKSEVELLQDLQAALWDIQNQRIDNVRLINNAVVFYREGAQGDESQMQFFPGARIPVQSPQDMVPWSPNTSILQPAIEAENRIMSDMERISGAVSAISGANPQEINGATATQYQGVVSMAAKRLMRKKQQVLYALRRVGLQQIKLNQMLLSQPEHIPPQPGAGTAWSVITPQQIQGGLEFEVEDVAESLLQEQRRAQALALAQFYIGNLPAFQAGGLLPNMGALGQMVDKAFDQEPGKFLSAAPPPPMMPPAPGGAAPPVTPAGAGGGTPSQMLEQGVA